MVWLFRNKKYWVKVSFLNQILDQYKNASFFEQCYIVESCKDFPLDWLVYLSINQTNRQNTPPGCYFFVNSKPFKNEFRELLLKTLGQEAHNRLRMIIDDRFYSKSYQHHNAPTTSQNPSLISLKKCTKYIKTLKNPGIYYQLKFIYYEIMEDLGEVFMNPPF